MAYEPTRDDKFTTGLWCTAFNGREVFDLVAGCMRSYLVLREKVQRFSADAEIQARLRELNVADDTLSSWTSTYSTDGAAALKNHSFDLDAMANRKLGYQRLDQLIFELLTGAR